MIDILELYYYFFIHLVVGQFTVQRDYIRSQFLVPIALGSVHPKGYQISLGKLYVLPYRPGTTTDPKIERLFFLYPEGEGNTVPQSLHLWSESYINYQSLKKEDTRWAEMDEMIDDWTRQCEEEGQAAQQ
jgi:hypothetical protein